jgi:hypothetical protein
MSMRMFDLVDDRVDDSESASEDVDAAAVGDVGDDIVDSVCGVDGSYVLVVLNGDFEYC